MIKRILRSKNSQNSFWNIFEVLVSPLILFISIPLFLTQLGTENYGIWMFVNTIVVLLQSLNLGLNTSTYKHVSSALSTEDEAQIKQTLSTNLSLTLLLSLIGFVIIGIIAFFILQFNVFIDASVQKSTLIYSLFLGGFILFSKLTEQILYAIYRAFEDFKYVTFISISSKIITVLGSVIIAYLTHNIVLVLLYNAFIGLCFLFINYRFIRRFLSFYRFQFQLTKAAIRFEVSYSFFVWLQSIAVVVTYQGDRLLVSSGFGLETLSYYTIVATIFNHIHMAFAALTGWVFPQIAKNQNDTSYIKQLYLNTRNVSAFITISLLAIFTFIAAPIFEGWLGITNFQHIAEYLNLFAMFEFVFIFTIMPNFFLNGSGYEKLNLKITLIYTLLNVIGMLLGYVVLHSVIGILIGLFVTTIIGMFILHVKMDKLFQLSQQAVFNTILLFIPSFLGCGIAYFDQWMVKLFFLAVTLISAYLLFIKKPNTSFNAFVQ
jgi:O-antigen/teichoic acid export membrane protein